MKTSEYLVFPEPGKVELRTGVLPAMTDDMIEVETVCSLVSPGTELQFFTGCHSDLKTGKRKYPTASGYSSTGVVTAVGRNVTSYRPGDRVMCMAGHASKFVILPAKVIPVPPEVDHHQASFAILGSIVLHCLREVSPGFGENVLITGLGTIGQIAIQLLRLTPVTAVYAADLIPERLEVADRNGADAVFDPTVVDVVSRLLELTDNRGCEIGIEASGSVKAFPTLLQAAAKRGRIFALGCPHGEAVLELYYTLQTKELSLIGSYQPNCQIEETVAHPWTQRRNRMLILDYLRQQRIDFRPLLTHVQSPTQAQEVFELLAERGGGVVSALFDWTGLTEV